MYLNQIPGEPLEEKQLESNVTPPVWLRTMNRSAVAPDSYMNRNSPETSAISTMNIVSSIGFSRVELMVDIMPQSMRMAGGGGDSGGLGLGLGGSGCAPAQGTHSGHGQPLREPSARAVNLKADEKNA